MDDKRKRQPSSNDPAEMRIRGLLENLLTTEASKTMFSKASSLQLSFLKESLQNIDDPNLIEDGYRKLLENLSLATNSHIVKGKENLISVQDNNSVIIATNHLGTAKITRIKVSDLGLASSQEEIEPFPIRHSPFIVIEKELNSKVFECAVELPEPFLSIQKASGVVLISASGENRTQKLIDSIHQKNLENSKTLFVMYPEGGTSGKRNNGTPYDLDEFHTGTLVAASKLNIPILPVCQKINPETGIELTILNPIRIDSLNTEDLIKTSRKLREEMQEQLV